MVDKAFRRRFRGGWALLCLWLALAGAARAGTDYTVNPSQPVGGTNYHTLEELLQANITWDDGDTITIGAVADNSLTAPLDFGDKDVTVTGGGIIGPGDDGVRFAVVGVGGALTLEAGNGKTLLFTGFNALSGEAGGAIHGDTGSIITLSGGENIFIKNEAAGSGGAVYAAGDGAFIAGGANTLFQGNTAGGVANAIHMDNSGDNKTLTLAAEEDYTLLLHDPVTSNSGNAGLTIHINSTDSGATATTGTVVFDGGYWIDQGHSPTNDADYFTSAVHGVTAVRHGTLALRNGVTYGAADDVGSFTLNAGATLATVGPTNTIQAGQITLANNSTLKFDLTGAVATRALLSLTANAYGSGIGTQAVDVADAGGLVGADAYLLATAGEGVVNPAGQLTYNGVVQDNLRSGLSIKTMTTDAARENLYIQNIGAGILNQTLDLVWNGSAGASDWNTTVGNRNWLTEIENSGNSMAINFASGDNVLFNDAADRKSVTVAAGGVSVAGMTVDNTTGNDYAFTTGAITSSSALIKNGTGTVTFDAGVYAGAMNINAGTVKIKDAAYDAALTGSGTFAVEQASATDAFTFGALVGNAFTGTVELIQGSLNIDANAATALTRATLQLDANAAAIVDGDRSIHDLTMNGGTLKFDVASITPGGVLTVAALGIDNGGTIMIDLDKTIVTTAADAQNLYDYATDASAARQKLVGATTINGAGTQLVWKDYDGDVLAAAQTRNIVENTTQTGVATFGYLGTVKADGIYLGYGLTQLEALDNRVVTLDSADSAATDPIINAKLTGSGGFTFGGTKNVSVGNSTSDYTGATTITGHHTVTMLTNGAFGSTSSLSLADSAKLDMDGKSLSVDTLSAAAGTEIVVGVLTVAGGDNSIAGILSGSGTLTKEGTGKLALAGINTFSGVATVSAGTFALDGAGSFASSTLTLETGATFDIAGANGDATLAGFEAAVGSVLATGANRLDLTGGKTLTLDLAGAVANDMSASALIVTGNGLLVDTTTRFSLKSLDEDMKKDEYIVLASAADGTLTDEVFQSGRMKYILEFDLGALLMRIAGISSFVDATNDFLGSAAPGNANIQNGGAHLDWLLTQPYGKLPDPGMETIEDYFTHITDNLTPAQALSEFQRMYGAYSAYGNRALQDDADRFRRRWRRQNHFFLDGFVFADLLRSSAGSGIASDSGLASPRYGARECVPAGTPRVWAGGFGAWTKQDARSGFAGYDYDSYGLAIGYEYTRDRLRLGVAAAYSRGDLEVDDLGYENKPDILNLALYGAYVHDSGIYLEGGLGYGHAWNDYHTDMLLGGRKTGKYGSDIFSADIELGYIARLACGYNLIPSLGLEYDYIRNDSWTEKVAGSTAPANRFVSGHDHALDIPIGLRANKAFTLANGSVIVPEVRASYVYTANKSVPTIQSGFAGAPGTATMRGVDPGRSHWRFGAGLSGQINRRVDFHVEYEFETRSGFKGHNLNASMGVSF